MLPRTPVMKTTPVTFPPGRLRLVTSPSLTGSLSVVKTIGILAVAALARRAERVFPTITATGRPIKSETSPGSRSNWFSGPAEVDHNAFTIDEASFLQGLT